MSTPTRTSAPSSAAARTPVNNLLGIAFGAVYLMAGIIGFAMTSGRGFASTHASEHFLGLFAINPLHNVVHLVVGMLLLAGGGLAGARGVNGLVGAVYLVVGVLGLFIASPDHDLNVLALNGWDNVLHLGTAVILLATALGADRRTRAARA